MKTKIYPLTPERWNDFEILFGPRGACAGCWCMFWKLTRKEFEAGKGEPNRLAQKAIVTAAKIPGLIAYVDEQPAGWIAVAPRSVYPGLGRSRILAPLDEMPVWSVPCFFVDKKYRRQGVTVALLITAIEYVKAQGGNILEGYPVEVKTEKAPPVFIYTGTVSAFQEAGFHEAGRRSATRPIMRYSIK
jgi:GNAT superfamily N-acetyltransferase